MSEQSVRPAVAAAVKHMREVINEMPETPDNDLAYMFVADMNRNGHAVVPIGGLVVDEVCIPLSQIDLLARAFVASKVGLALGLARAGDSGVGYAAIVLELEEALAICAPKP